MGLAERVSVAVERLRAFEPAEGYWLAFSGGKDSSVLYALAERAGVRFEGHYNATTVDPPELVRHIRRAYPAVIVDRPAENMWALIVRRGMPPTRIVRYCCEELKERGGEGRVVLTGVRWAESVRRRRRGVLELNAYSRHGVVLLGDPDDRRLFERCPVKSMHIVNPIVDWTDADVWRFVGREGIEVCELYEQGYRRLGCVACPMSGAEQRRRDLERWPHFRRLYVRAFERMLERRRARGLATSWQDGEDVMALVAGWLTWSPFFEWSASSAARGRPRR